MSSLSCVSLTKTMTRRSWVLGALSLACAVSGCAPDLSVAELPRDPVDPGLLAMYGARPDERFPLPATDISQIDPMFFRQEVAYHRSDPIGTIVVDPGAKFLYLVMENGRALRYGVGVGKAGLVWSGNAQIRRKAEWPRWTPTPDMLARDPALNGPWRNGMPGGLGNPLGARALYLFDGDRDTLYRLHGTTEPNTIGTNVSSGCIRLINQDVIDLYDRVPVYTNVIVLPVTDHVEPLLQSSIARDDANKVL